MIVLRSFNLVQGVRHTVQEKIIKMRSPSTKLRAVSLSNGAYGVWFKNDLL